MVRISSIRITASEIIFKRNLSSVFVSGFRRIRPNCEDGLVSSDAIKETVRSRIRHQKALNVNFRLRHSASEKLIVGKGSKSGLVQDKTPTTRNGQQRARFYSNVEEKNLLLKETKSQKDDWGTPEAKELILHIEGNFKESIKSHDSLLVYFYTVWCKHCKRFKPVYGAAAVKMKDEDVPGRLGAMDLTKRMDIGEMYNIVSVPALKYFKKGEFVKVYEGKRTTEDIINFMKNPGVDQVAIPKIDI